MLILAAGTSKPAGSDTYLAQNSLRFRSSASAYLLKTFSTSGTSSTIKTFSAWIKRSGLGSTQRIIESNSTVANNTYLNFDSGDTLSFSFDGSTSIVLTTTQVFRDVSAWYHIMVAIDTTQATSTNRVKLYVNGSQITSFSTATYPALNATTSLLGVGSNGNNYIGCNYNGTSSYFNGYITEIYGVDGQALTPSSFGATNADTGVWRAKAYTGTYGTNGFYLPLTTSQLNTLYATTGTGFSTYAASFENPYSANFTGGAVGSGNYTFECWFYLKYIDPTNDVGLIGVSSNSGFNIRIGSTGNRIAIDAYNSSSSSFTVPQLVVNTWYHVAVVRSTGSTTVFLNGTRSSTGAVTVSTNYSGTTSRLGTIDGASTSSITGLISNLRLVIGTAVYSPASTTITVPTSALTNITNTKVLTFQDSTFKDNSTNNYAITPTSLPIQESSGNFNSWYGTNISITAGTTYDSMTDVPTLTSATAGNFPTLTSLVPFRVFNSYTNGNLTANNGNVNSNQVAVVNMAFGTGKYYWETTLTAFPSGGTVGVMDVQNISGGSTTIDLGAAAGTYAYLHIGNKSLSGTSSAYGAPFTTGDVIAFTYDGSTGVLVAYKNNVSQGTMTTLSTSSQYVAAFGCGNTTSTVTININFGQRPFTYTPPTGYVALNTYNLPTPTILQGNKWMDATTYTGTGASNAITNASAFKPDFVWIKSRGAIADHIAYDSNRGVTAELSPNQTAAEATVSTRFSSFNTNGFTVTGTSSASNASAATFVGWQWQANGGSTSSNTSGSITSTVQANTTAGFSIVTYTGTGANATVGHGLGIAPKMYIVKKRSAASSWVMYHGSLAATQRMILETTAAVATDASVWNSTAPTSSVFSLGNDAGVNGSGASMIAYVWSEISGFSKFGSYTGNGSSDGTFIFTGFRPKFFLVKNTASADWQIYDTSRDTYNEAFKIISPDTSGVEDTASPASTSFDILSNGIKLRRNWICNNLSGNTYIYMAFAENPLKFSNAR